MSSACFDDEAVVAFVEGRLTEQFRRRFDEHLDRCPRCRRHVIALVSQSVQSLPACSARSGGAPLDGIRAAVGDSLGRFTLIRSLGRGAAGAVWEAYDSGLDRMVAIKLLRIEVSDLHTARRRIVPEARALARLSHPNVVRVFSVLEDVPAIVMELVHGVPWAVWRTTARPDLRRILDAGIQAAQGLAALHRAGLVHRDVSPRNLLVTADDRVLVTDLGLAEADDRRGPDFVGPMGTPGYIAPELFAGRRADAASDQWSLATILLAALADSAGASDPPLMVPRQIDLVIRRAAHPIRERRFPSMEAFIAALRRARASRARTWWLLAGLAGAVSLAILVPRPSGSCEDLARLDRIDTALSPSVAEPMALAFRDRVSQWHTLRLEVCELEGPARDERIECLQWHRHRLEAMARALRDGRAVTREDVGALSQESLTDACTSDADLGSGLRAPELASIDGLRDAGAYAQALVTAERVAKRAQATDDVQLLAAARLREGALLLALDRHADAFARFETAYWTARRVGNEAIAFAAAARLVPLGGALDPDFDVAMNWSRHAEAALRRGQLGAGELAVLRAAVAGAQHARARYDDAIASARLALAALAEHDEASRLEPEVHDLLACALAAYGDAPSALRHHAIAIEQAEDRLGASHPFVGAARSNRARSLELVGRLDEAAMDLELAIANADASVGPQSVRAGTFRYNLAMIRARQGELGPGLALIDDVLEVFASAYGPDSQQLAQARLGKALLLRETGDFAGAEAEAQRSLQILISRLGADHDVVGSTWAMLGWIALEARQYEQAIERHRRALDIAEHLQGVDSPVLLDSIVALAEASLQLGRLDVAEAYCERGLDMCGPEPTPPCPEIAFVAARVQLSKGARMRARELARDARARADAALAQKIDQWLADL